MIVSKLARTTFSLNKSNVIIILSILFLSNQYGSFALWQRYFGHFLNIFAHFLILISNLKLKLYGIIYRNLASDSKPGIFRRSFRSKDATGSGAFPSSAPSYTRRFFLKNNV